MVWPRVLPFYVHSSDDSIDPNEELVPIDEAPGMSAGEDVEGIE